MQIVQDFKQPQGTTKDDTDAAGDGEVLAVLDLRFDDSLVKQGMEREVANRVQRLKKRSRFVVADKVGKFVVNNFQGTANAGD